MKQLASFLGFIIFVSAISAGVRNGTGEPVMVDTTIPKYRYIMKAEIPSGQYFASLDTIHSIIPIIGKTLIVDDAEYWRSLLINQIIRLTQYARPDSVKIENKKP